MIRLHRLGHATEPFHLNPDLVVTIEGTPDTVVMLTSGTRMLVCESPEEVVDAIRDWRAGVLASAVARSGSVRGLTLVRGTAREVERS